MTCHMTFYRAAPPLQPQAFQPTIEQARFLALHAAPVTKWQWLFSETMLRATTDTGATATIWRDALDELIDQGLMRWGHGQQVCLTNNYSQQEHT